MSVKYSKKLNVSARITYGFVFFLNFSGRFFGAALFWPRKELTINNSEKYSEKKSDSLTGSAKSKIQTGWRVGNRTRHFKNSKDFSGQPIAHTFVSTLAHESLCGQVNPQEPWNGRVHSECDEFEREGMRKTSNHGVWSGGPAATAAVSAAAVEAI